MTGLLIVYNSLVKGTKNYIYRHPSGERLDIEKVKAVIEKADKVKDITILNIINLNKF